MTQVTHLRSSPLFSVDDDGKVHYQFAASRRPLNFKIYSRDAFIAVRFGNITYYAMSDLSTQGTNADELVQDLVTTNEEYRRLLRALMTSTTPFYRDRHCFILYARHQLWIMRNELTVVSTIPDQFAPYMNYAFPLIVKIDKVCTITYQVNRQYIILTNTYEARIEHCMVAVSAIHSVIAAAPIFDYIQLVVRDDIKRQYYFGIMYSMHGSSPIRWYKLENHPDTILHYEFTRDVAFYRNTDGVFYRNAHGVMRVFERTELDNHSSIPVKVYFF